MTPEIFESDLLQSMCCAILRHSEVVTLVLPRRLCSSTFPFSHNKRESRTSRKTLNRNMGSEMPPPPPPDGSSAALPAIPPPANPSPYVILCDAGSTGTRLYVYSLPFGQHTSSNPTDLPYDLHAVQIQEGPKIKPGLSAQTPKRPPPTSCRRSRRLCK